MFMTLPRATCPSKSSFAQKNKNKGTGYAYAYFAANSCAFNHKLHLDSTGSVRDGRMTQATKASPVKQQLGHVEGENGQHGNNLSKVSPF